MGWVNPSFIGSATIFVDEPVVVNDFYGCMIKGFYDLSKESLMFSLERPDVVLGTRTSVALPVTEFRSYTVTRYF